MRTSQKIYLPFKRIIGILGSIIGIIFCLLLFWWWVLLINLIATKGHPIFGSKRVGKDDKVFSIFKFRSMKNNIDPCLTSEEIKRIEDPYTWFGKFLRKSNIDETLQLFNILFGQMSFIGPRPLIDSSEDHITIELRKQNEANKLRPGISGYAQINGRTDISATDKAEFDGFYKNNISFILDFKIFVITILQSLRLRKKPNGNPNC